MHKQVLYFFHESPFSKRAGNVTRTYSTLKILKQFNYQIDLVGSFEDYSNQKDIDIPIDENLISNFNLIRRKPKKNKLSFEYWKYKIINLFSKNKSNRINTIYFAKQINSLIQRKKYDIIFINYEFIAQTIDFSKIKNSLKIIDTHDWITLNTFFNNPKLNIGKKFNNELNNLKKFDKIITISKDEHFIFSNFLGQNKVFNIPQSFVSNYIKNNIKFQNKKYDLIFVGSDNHFNEISIKWFLKEIYPFLPLELNYLFVGRVCKFIEDKNNITKILFAENLDEYYFNSKISICPMLKGTGIKIKVVEALSYGLPVIGTEKAIDGFNFKQKNGCLVDDSAEKFIENINLLLNNNSEYEKIKQEGISYFENNFSEAKNLKLWKEIINIVN